MPRFGIGEPVPEGVRMRCKNTLDIFVQCNIYRFAAVELRRSGESAGASVAMKPQGPAATRRDGERR
jgi:hypothetical protein